MMIKTSDNVNDFLVPDWMADAQDFIHGSPSLCSNGD
jgi:hypothetical protein